MSFCMQNTPAKNKHLPKDAFSASQTTSVYQTQNEAVGQAPSRNEELRVFMKQ